MLASFVSERFWIVPPGHAGIGVGTESAGFDDVNLTTHQCGNDAIKQVSHGGVTNAHLLGNFPDRSTLSRHRGDVTLFRGETQNIVVSLSQDSSRFLARGRSGGAIVFHQLIPSRDSR